MHNGHFDLGQSAHAEMTARGFTPDFGPAEMKQAAELSRNSQVTAAPGARDLRGLLWSSIDNDTSRDLDQIEYAERVSEGIRVLVGVADVDSDVPVGSPIDAHARAQTTTVYTPVRIFPMLPEALSTGLTSLNPDEDRLAVVIEFVVSANGEIGGESVYAAVVRNHFQLAYSGVGPWLSGEGSAPGAIASHTELAAQLKLQDEAACLLREQRHRLGALVFDRVEPEAVVKGGQIEAIRARKKNRASDLIEDFMVAANEVMARRLSSAGAASLRRVVKTPERWARIVALAGEYGGTLPAEPDSGALQRFLMDLNARDSAHYPDVSLGILKLMGPGEYVVERAGEGNPGHFGLATHDYTHSTAPNRRFADLVTQRSVKAVMGGAKTPYNDDDLEQIARNCTLKEDAARKVERTMNKRAAALAYAHRVGQQFRGVVTGVTPNGTYVRVMNPPIEGRVMRGEKGLDVGDCVTMTLIHTDPARGFIDFALKR